MYVETSAINNDSRSTNSAFEVRKCLAIKFHTRRNPGECRSLVWLPLDNSPGHPLLRDLFPGVAQGGGMQVSQGNDDEDMYDPCCC